ncbi:MAG: polysaccharide deacetylase family protein [Thermodesulfobacteriota bacterium]|nr:polysaccharide deacetylase family protein [Thermodesulfobacteriota bacterium]
MEKINALAIDTEEWFHSELLGGQRPPFFQVPEATQQVLNLLDRYQTKGTFFIVGEVAERHPELVRLIFEKGHEIGCHGFSHHPLWKLSEALFREELKRFHSVIEGILGKIPIRGFRAPSFSLDNRTKWALGVLIEYGYQYDASIFPVKLNPLYGVRGAPTQPYHISLEDVRKEDPCSPLMEFPLCPLKIGRLKIPISGGFYLRALPLPFLLWGLRRINRKQPFLLYFHPWEGYAETPRLKLSFTNRLISYYGIHSALKKLESLLNHFKFARVDQILGLR